MLYTPNLAPLHPHQARCPEEETGKLYCPVFDLTLDLATSVTLRFGAVCCHDYCDIVQ